MMFDPKTTRPIAYIYRHSPEWCGINSVDTRYMKERIQYNPFTYVHTAFRHYLDTHDFPRKELPKQSVYNSYVAIQHPHVIYRRTKVYCIYCIYRYIDFRLCPFSIDETGELKVYDPFMFSDEMDYEDVSTTDPICADPKYSISNLQILCRMFSKPFPILF